MRADVPDRRVAFGVPLFVAALVAAAAMAASATGAPAPHNIVLWTVANGAQYLNNGDDRGRGIHDNPFDAAQSRLKPKVRDAGSGPFPGDVGVFTLSLYANASLQKSIGSGAYTCYYNYNKHALCEAYYQLNQGTLVASGIVDFDNTARFKLIITGGTQSYRDARGELSAFPSGRAERVDLMLLATGEPGGAPRGGEGKKQVVYAVATAMQFINHEDDRRRGMTNNPFEVNRAKNLKVVLKGTEKKNGPFPGDDVLYSFKLYSSASRAKQLGSAVFTCYYDIAKHATCEAYFGLVGGSLLATGSVVFDSSRFRLSVGGGTNSYLGVRGEIASAPAAKQSQRFELALR